MSHPNQTILVFGPIDNDVAGLAIAQFMEMDHKKHVGGITIKLCSEGGSATAGLALYDVLQHGQNIVTTEGYGEVSSVAALVFQAGDHRLIAPHCRMLLHHAQLDVTAGRMTGKDMVGVTSHITETDRIYRSVFVERGGLDDRVVADWCNAERVFTAKEAVQNRIADRIIGATS